MLYESFFLRKWFSTVFTLKRFVSCVHPEKKFVSVRNIEIIRSKKLITSCGRRDFLCQQMFSHSLHTQKVFPLCAH